MSERVGLDRACAGVVLLQCSNTALIILNHNLSPLNWAILCYYEDAIEHYMYCLKVKWGLKPLTGTIYLEAK